MHEASGRVVVVGDAAHPFPQGGLQTFGMLIEDAAVLGNLFSRLTHASQIGPLLRAYEGLRLRRTANTQASSRLNQKIFHLPDGPAQEARDADMRAAMDVEFRLLAGEQLDVTLEGSHNQWADRKKNAEQFGYDADAAADRWWAEVGEKEVAPLGQQQAIKVNGRL